jgi:hypothetical protein
VHTTTDEILREFRFCNVFRAADRVSQHLIQKAAYGEPDLDADDLFLRVVLHRLFCRPSTWDLLEDRIGRIEARSFSERVFGQVLDEAWAAGRKLYTAAYVLSASPSYGYERKHRNHLALLAAMLRDGVPARIASAGSLAQVYRELLEWPLIGPFMAYQLAVDLNYSPIMEFSENAFTMPGPGALRGLAKVFCSLGELTPSDAILWLVDKQHETAQELGVVAPKLFGRDLHAIDCQNLLCEVDKYSRVAFPELSSNRSMIKQRYAPDPLPYLLFFPPEWRINDAIPHDWRLVVDAPAPV